MVYLPGEKVSPVNPGKLNVYSVELNLTNAMSKDKMENAAEATQENPSF